MMVPSGFRFMPTGEVLIGHYLFNKTMGQTSPYEDHLLEYCDLYGSQSPWELFNENDQRWVESIEKKSVKSIYVFTTLKYLGKIGTKRMARTCGSGSWHMESAAKPILEKKTGREIGKMETFTFICNDEHKKGSTGHWIMHEYALSGSSLEFINGRSISNKYVVCRISRDDAKLLKVVVKKNSKTKKATDQSNEVHVNYEFHKKDHRIDMSGSTLVSSKHDDDDDDLEDWINNVWDEDGNQENKFEDGNQENKLEEDGNQENNFEEDGAQPKSRTSSVVQESSEWAEDGAHEAAEYEPITSLLMQDYPVIKKKNCQAYNGQEGEEEDDDADLGLSDFCIYLDEVMEILKEDTSHGPEHAKIDTDDCIISEDQQVGSTKRRSSPDDIEFSINCKRRRYGKDDVTSTSTVTEEDMFP